MLMWGYYAPMSYVLELVTTSREAIIDLTRVLTQGIDPVFLSDREKPVLISLDGPPCCGKSIFPDIVRAELLGVDNDPVDNFRPGANWTGRAYGMDIEISFANANPVFLPSFLKRRELGGITLVSNSRTRSEAFYSGSADIRIHMGIDRYLKSLPSDIYESSLKYSFNAASNAERFVHIEIRDGSLLSSMRFLHALDKLNQQKDVSGAYSGDPLLKTPAKFCSDLKQPVW